MSTQATPPICIAGAGIIGLSTGIALLERNFRVMLFDPMRAGRAASYGNAGIIATSECLPLGSPEILRKIPLMLLSPSYPLRVRPSYIPTLIPWFIEFLKASRDPMKVLHSTTALSSMLSRARDTHLNLASKINARQLFQSTGWLKAYESDKSFKAVEPSYHMLERNGVVCQYLDARSIQEKEPALAPIFRHAIWHPDCMQVSDLDAYLDLLLKAFLERGGMLTRIAIDDFQFDGNRISHVVAQGQNYPCSNVVVAAGAWSKALAEKLGHSVPLDTERGYHAMLSPPVAGALHGPVYWDEKGIVMAPMKSGLRITTGVEFGGLKAPPNLQVISKLMPSVKRALPTYDPQPRSTWLGFRPSVPDSLPFIGQSNKTPNAYLAFGHGHLGLTLGPLTGQLLARQISGEPAAIDLAPFRVDRFEKPRHRVLAKPSS